MLSIQDCSSTIKHHKDHFDSTTSEISPNMDSSISHVVPGPPHHASALVDDEVPDHVPEDGHVVAHSDRREVGQAVFRDYQITIVTIIKISLRCR